MAILARISIFFAEYPLPERGEQRTDIRGGLTADEGRRIGQGQQRPAIVQAGAHDTREHRGNPAILDRVVPAIDLKADVGGVDRPARRVDARLGGRPLRPANARPARAIPFCTTAAQPEIPVHKNPRSALFVDGEAPISRPHSGSSLPTTPGAPKS